MKDLIEQLGINWKLLISQAVNFFILLAILRIFVYKPVLNLIKNRTQKIEQGLVKAQEADIRLKEIDNIAKEKIKEAENSSMAIIKETQGKAKELDSKLTKEVEEKRDDLMKKAQIAAQAKIAQSEEIIKKEAVELVKKTIAKTVELDPDKIDEALIEKALSQIE